MPEPAVLRGVLALGELAVSAYACYTARAGTPRVRWFRCVIGVRLDSSFAERDDKGAKYRHPVGEWDTRGSEPLMTLTCTDS